MQIFDIKPTSFKVSWGPPQIPSESSFVEYQYFATATDGEITSNCTTRYDVHCIINGLRPDTLYNVTGVSCDLEKEECSPLLSAPITARTQPAAPKHIQATVLTATSVNVSWAPSPTPDDSGSGKRRVIVTATGGESISRCTTFDETHCRLTGLNPDTRYSITVVACSAVTSECSTSMEAPIFVTTQAIV
ncbi:unnamed protein product [Dibothriocephalus latus]|uniref:Fibronectin type-III domain-containing protein n=1 Tax=Dibothriocephalus latus TaxID=60516 RepID=A0A3P6Q4G4_DIBLA|nr:unnamed protein product [Dibothriocephalus latus]